MANVDLVALVDSAEDSSVEQHERLFAVLYEELHRMAQRELRRNAAVTLSPTTLLHETFLNVSQREGAVFADRARFMAYAARAMRGLLDRLRAQSAGAEARRRHSKSPHCPTELPQLAAEDVRARASWTTRSNRWRRSSRGSPSAWI